MNFFKILLHGLIALTMLVPAAFAQEGGRRPPFSILSSDFRTQDRDDARAQEGSFAALEGGIDIMTNCSGPYSIRVELQSHDGQKISTRPMYEYTSSVNHPTQQFISAEENERHHVRFQFSGEEIRRAGVDGAYRVKIINWPYPELKCAQNIDLAAVLWLTTPPYKAKNFGENCGSGKTSRPCGDVYE